LPQPTGPRPPAARLGTQLQRAPVQPQHADAAQPRGSRRAPQNGNGALRSSPGGPPALPSVQVSDWSTPLLSQGTFVISRNTSI